MVAVVVVSGNDGDQCRAETEQIWPVTGAKRVARAHAAAAAVRQDLDTWFNLRRSEQVFARFGAHFDVLETVLGQMLDAISAQIAGIAPEHTPTGQVYESCRASQHRLDVIRALHEWYAGKYDQRLDRRWSATLAAADAVVRSCWVAVFRGGVARPEPVTYLDPRYDASATSKTSAASVLRASDTVVDRLFVPELPIPMIALPAGCAAEPWWLVLVAHETGHHVQQELLDNQAAVNATGRAVENAVAAAPGGAELARAWKGWGREAFADAFSVLMVGTAAAWAIDELQFGATTRLVALPSVIDRYPPPACRRALLGELARGIGLPDPGPGMTEVLRWLEGLADDAVAPATRAQVAAHVAVTPVVARTLLDLDLDGHTLREWSGWPASAVADAGLIARWAGELVRVTPMIAGLEQRWAGRIAIAGGVRAYRDLAAREPADRLTRLRANLPTVLGVCGGSGHLVAMPRVDVGAIAARLTALLLEQRPDGSPL